MAVRMALFWAAIQSGTVCASPSSAVMMAARTEAGEWPASTRIRVSVGAEASTAAGTISRVTRKLSPGASSTGMLPVRRSGMIRLPSASRRSRGRPFSSRPEPM